MTYNEYNACRDREDERDYKYSSIYKEELAGVQLPSKAILDNVEYQNQGAQKETTMWCVFYSTWHGSNQENYDEWSKVRIDCIDFCKIAVENWVLDVDKGAYVSDWPKLAKQLWYIEWWALVTTLDEIKHSIVNKRPVVVWANQIDWKKWYDFPNILWGTSWSWHAIVIIWYDDNYYGWCFIIKNSYWASKYDQGKMYILYTDFNLLFNSKYSLIDKKDPIKTYEDKVRAEINNSKYSLIDKDDTILIYKKQIMSEINIEKAKEAFELGLWNGENPKQPASREEVATMILRGLETFKAWEI